MTGSTGTGSTSGSTTSGSTTDESSSTTEEGPMCNNGIVEGDEECDDAQLSFNGPCIPGCFLNVCGDGHHNFEGEGCDLGEQNGQYGSSCGVDCEEDSFVGCGDGIVQPDYEQCEGDDLHDEYDIECVDCAWGGFRAVFVTSIPFNGAMEGGGLPNHEDPYSGIKLADFRCQQLAGKAELAGTFHAWLSDNNGTEDYSNAADRVKGAGSGVSFRMRNGGVIAESWEELVAEGPSKAVVFTEWGVELDEVPSRTWTNTDQTGMSLGNGDCNGWTTSSPMVGGSIGFTTKEEWVDANAEEVCISKLHLYCFQGEG